MSKDVNDNLLVEDWWGEPANFCRESGATMAKDLSFFPPKGPEDGKFDQIRSMTTARDKAVVQLSF